MAKKQRRKAGRRDADRKAANATPGWVYLSMGLAIGLAVAYAVYVSDRKTPIEPAAAPVAKTTKEPASSVPEVIEESPEADITFDFYDMLPNLDVELYEEQRVPPVVTAPVKVTPQAQVARPGIYILQAGSFSQLTDANRRKAQLALLGVHSDIKKGTANGRAVYRVYTDPMEKPEDVNRVSDLLTNANIEILRKRVSD
jgi:cell division protein FtsN